MRIALQVVAAVGLALVLLALARPTRASSAGATTVEAHDFESLRAAIASARPHATTVVRVSASLVEFAEQIQVDGNKTIVLTGGEGGEKNLTALLRWRNYEWTNVRDITSTYYPTALPTYLAKPKYRNLFAGTASISQWYRHGLGALPTSVMWRPRTSALEQNTFLVLSLGGEIFDGTEMFGDFVSTGDLHGVRDIGDFNGDGFTDLGVAKAEFAPGVETSLVCTFRVYFGGLPRLAKSVSFLADYVEFQSSVSPVTRPANNARLATGCLLAKAKDHNGDGMSDLIMSIVAASAQNASRTLFAVDVVFGRRSWPVNNVQNPFNLNERGTLDSTRVRIAPDLPPEFVYTPGQTVTLDAIHHFHLFEVFDIFLYLQTAQLATQTSYFEFFSGNPFVQEPLVRSRITLPRNTQIMGCGDYDADAFPDLYLLHTSPATGAKSLIVSFSRESRDSPYFSFEDQLVLPHDVQFSFMSILDDLNNDKRSQLFFITNNEYMVYWGGREPRFTRFDYRVGSAIRPLSLLNDDINEDGYVDLVFTLANATNATHPLTALLVESPGKKDTQLMNQPLFHVSSGTLRVNTSSVALQTGSNRKLPCKPMVAVRFSLQFNQNVTGVAYAEADTTTMVGVKTCPAPYRFTPNTLVTCEFGLLFTSDEVSPFCHQTISVNRYTRLPERIPIYLQTEEYTLQRDVFHAYQIGAIDSTYFVASPRLGNDTISNATATGRVDVAAYEPQGLHVHPSSWFGPIFPFLRKLHAPFVMDFFSRGVVQGGGCAAQLCSNLTVVVHKFDMASSRMWMQTARADNVLVAYSPFLAETFSHYMAAKFTQSASDSSATALMLTFVEVVDNQTAPLLRSFASVNRTLITSMLDVGCGMRPVTNHLLAASTTTTAGASSSFLALVTCGGENRFFLSANYGRAWALVAPPPALFSQPNNVTVHALFAIKNYWAVVYASPSSATLRRAYAPINDPSSAWAHDRVISMYTGSILLVRVTQTVENSYFVVFEDSKGIVGTDVYESFLDSASTVLKTWVEQNPCPRSGPPGFACNGTARVPCPPGGYEWSNHTQKLGTASTCANIKCEFGYWCGMSTIRCTDTELGCFPLQNRYRKILAYVHPPTAIPATLARENGTLATLDYFLDESVVYPGKRTFQKGLVRNVAKSFGDDYAFIWMEANQTIPPWLSLGLGTSRLDDGEQDGSIVFYHINSTTYLVPNTSLVVQAVFDSSFLAQGANDSVASIKFYWASSIWERELKSLLTTTTVFYVHIRMRLVPILVTPSRFDLLAVAAGNDTTDRFQLFNTLPDAIITFSAGVECAAASLARSRQPPSWLQLAPRSDPVTTLNANQGDGEAVAFVVKGSFFSDNDNHTGLVRNVSGCAIRLNITVIQTFDGSSVNVPVLVPVSAAIVRKCLPGSFSTTGTDGASSSCQPCAEGTYVDKLGQTLCLPCSANLVSARGASRESDCVAEPGSFLNGSQVIACRPPNQVSSPYEGVNCTTSNLTTQSLVILPGYWRARLTSLDIKKCPREKYCVGGVGHGGGSGVPATPGNARGLSSSLSAPSSATAEVDGYCAENHTGVFCYTCLPGYVKHGDDLLCGLCDSNETTHDSGRVVIFAFVLLLILFLFGTSWIRCIRMRSYKNPHLMNARVVDQSGNLLRLLIGLLQVLGGVSILFENELPSGMVQFFKVVNVIGVQVVGLFNFGCAMENSYMTRLIVSTTIPLLLSALIFITYRVALLFPRFRDDWKKVQHLFFELFLILTFLVFPGVTANIMSAFNCSEIDQYSYLVSDPQISCGSSYYNSAVLPLAVVMVIVYVIGIPALYVIVLLRKRELILHPGKTIRKKKEDERRSRSRNGGESNEENHDPNTVGEDDEDEDEDDDELYESRIDPRTLYARFLYEPYKRRFYMFEVFQLVRKFVLTSLTQFVGQYTRSKSEVAQRTVFLMFFCAAWSVLVAMLQPYEEVYSSWLDIICNGAIFVIAFCSLLTNFNIVLNSVVFFDQGVLDGIMVAAVAVPFIFSAVVFGLEMRRAYGAYGRAIKKSMKRRMRRASEMSRRMSFSMSMSRSWTTRNRPDAPFPSPPPLTQTPPTVKKDGVDSSPTARPVQDNQPPPRDHGTTMSMNFKRGDDVGDHHVEEGGLQDFHRGEDDHGTTMSLNFKRGDDVGDHHVEEGGLQDFHRDEESHGADDTPNHAMQLT